MDRRRKDWQGKDFGEETARHGSKKSSKMSAPVAHTSSRVSAAKGLR